MCCCYIVHQGCTGFPWIDAVMRQLRIEGWIPHVARLAVGCFLTRGCLWINWEEGYKVWRNKEQVKLLECEKVLVCFRELEELLNQFFLSRSLDAFKSSYGLVLPTNVREKLYLWDSKKCN